MKNLIKKIPYIKYLYRKYRKLFSFCGDELSYLDSKLNSKPYYGSKYAANQTREFRRELMFSFIKKQIENKEDFNVLEIGTWAGSSASVWGKAVKGKGVVICIDTWEYMNLEKLMDPNSWKKTVKAYKKNHILNLFLHNIKTEGLEHVIYPIKAPSEVVSRFLKPESFDFIYFDTGYDYEKVMRDLKEYYPLLKKGGVLGGDDFDTSHEYKKKAINDFLGRVEVNDGFWTYKKLD